MPQMSLLIVMIMATFSHAAEPEGTAGAVPPAFAVVLIDAQTEQLLGPFPYDRALYAKAIDAAARAGARGVVLKFFIDRPKSPEGDAALVAAMKRTKVVVQAKLDDEEAKPNAMAEQFIMKRVEVRADNRASPPSGKSGWLPLPEVAAAAHDMGFLAVSDTVDRVPLLVKYQGRYVKSLYIAALELAVGEPATAVAGQAVKIAGKSIPLDPDCTAKVTLPKEDKMIAYSFVDLINGKIPAEALKERVLVLGYDGKQMPPINTTMGKVTGHRVFSYQTVLALPGCHRREKK